MHQPHTITVAPLTIAHTTKKKREAARPPAYCVERLVAAHLDLVFLLNLEATHHADTVLIQEEERTCVRLGDHLLHLRDIGKNSGGHGVGRIDHFVA
jgi:hypothetical protein